MKKINIRIISIMAITALLSTGFVYASAAPLKNVSNVCSNTLSVSPEKTIIPKTAEDAATLWAEALGERNGAFRYMLLTSTLRTTEYDKYSKMNWIIGGSSPRVVL